MGPGFVLGQSAVPADASIRLRRTAVGRVRCVAEKEPTPLLKCTRARWVGVRGLVGRNIGEYENSPIS